MNHLFRDAKDRIEDARSASQPYTFLQGDGHLIAETQAWLLEVITEKKPTWKTPRFTVLDRDEVLMATRT